MAYRTAFAGLLLLGLSAVPAWSAPACDPGPSNEDKQACTPDVYAHCNDYIPNVDQITQCLKKNISLLSGACQAVMKRPPPKVNLPPCRPEQGGGG